MSYIAIKTAILISKKKEDSLKIGSVDIIRDWSYAGDMADAIFKINNIRGYSVFYEKLFNSNEFLKIYYQHSHDIC